jgi:CBS domain-containing protein
MILGMSASAFLQLHVILSLVGIFTGVIVVFGMLSASTLPTWTALFLITTVATSVTGFMFPGTGLDPARIVGIISLLVLAIAIAALYIYHLAGAWRWLYVASSVSAVYLNTFVGVVQAFQKVSFLHPLAPTGSEPPFIVAQVLVVALFIVLGILATKKFHPAM